MAKTPSVYGFELGKAQILSGIADRESTRQRNGGSAEYPSLGRRRDTNIVQVMNTSGDNRRAGDIVEFTGFATSKATSPALPDSTEIVLNGGSPTLANGFGVLLSAVKSADGPVDCQISGACVAFVNVADTDHTYAVVTASTFVLQSSIIGPVRIIHKASGTGEKSCVVMINDVVGECLVKNASGSDIAVNSSGTFQLWTGTPGSESYANCDVTAYNKTSTAFKNGKFGAVSYLNGKAYAVPFQT